MGPLLPHLLPLLVLLLVVLCLLHLATLPFLLLLVFF